MGIFDRFPYSSTHEMNLDFMLGKATEIAESLQEVQDGLSDIDTHKAQAEQAAQAAQASQAAASASAGQAAQHKTDAEDAADRAEAAATEAETAADRAETALGNITNAETVCTEAAEEAQQYAEASQTHSGQAQIYKNAAEAAKNSAELNASQAATSAGSAANSATDAASSANSANVSATNASLQASNAATSATNAATSETNAADAADRAETAAQNASTAADGAITSATAAETRINTLAASLPEDFTDLNNEVTDLQSAFDELNNPQYSGTLLPLVNGTVNSISDDGVINIGTNYTYRVCTKEVLTVSKALDISIAEGFRIYVFKKTPGTSSYSGSGWITGSYSLPTVGTTYVFTIARVTENPSETANIDEFGGAITYSIPLRTARDELNEVEKLSESIKPFEEGAYDNRHIVKSIAHRGFESVAPENTIPAFQLAVKKGFRFIETDVMLTSDNVPVCLHDSTINRTARNSDGTELSSTINIYEITYAQAQEYDFGIWKGSTYAGTKIPTLEEFLVFCRNTGTSPYIELKYYTVWDQATLLNAVTNVVKKCGMSNYVTYISAAQGYLMALIGYSDIKRVGKICAAVTQSEIDNAEALRTNDIESFLDATSVSDAMVTACATAGVPVELYGLNSSADILEANTYISGITSGSIHAGRVLFSNALN